MSAWVLAALEHAKAAYPGECCGAVVMREGVETYVPCRNVATGNDTFQPDPWDIVRVEDEHGPPIAWVHSHGDQDRPRACADDIRACDSSRVPWHILSWPQGEWRTIQPAHVIPPLEGREFTPGALDCYTLVRDYYRLHHGILLPHYDRPDSWWEHGLDLYTEHYTEAGFVRREGSPQPGDALLMRVGARVPNHAAIYLEGDRILHHLAGGLSCIEPWDGRWRDRTVMVLHYADA